MLRSSKRRRTTLRLAHLALSLPLGFALYAPPDLAQPVHLFLQIIGFPALILTGLWMWLAPKRGRFNPR